MNDGHTPTRRPSQASTIADRYISGDSIRAIANDLGLRRQRVADILTQMNVPRRPRRAARPVGPAERQLWVQQYLAGASIGDLASRHNRSRATIAAQLTRAAVVLRPTGATCTVTERQARAMAALYRKGLSLHQVAQETGRARGVVRDALLRVGVQLRPRGHHSPAGTPSEPTSRHHGNLRPALEGS